MPFSKFFSLPVGRLKPLDVEFMKALHGKVNIVPVIAKADTLTLKERERLKRRVGLTLDHESRATHTMLKPNISFKLNRGVDDIGQGHNLQEA